jgi:hypothetical protein
MKPSTMTTMHVGDQKQASRPPQPFLFPGTRIVVRGHLSDFVAQLRFFYGCGVLIGPSWIPSLRGRLGSRLSSQLPDARRCSSSLPRWFGVPPGGCVPFRPLAGARPRKSALPSLAAPRSASLRNLAISLSDGRFPPLCRSGRTWESARSCADQRGGGIRDRFVVAQPVDGFQPTQGLSDRRCRSSRSRSSLEPCCNSTGSGLPGAMFISARMRRTPSRNCCSRCQISSVMNGISGCSRRSRVSSSLHQRLPARAGPLRNWRDRSAPAWTVPDTSRRTRSR